MSPRVGSLLVSQSQRRFCLRSGSSSSSSPLTSGLQRRATATATTTTTGAETFSVLGWQPPAKLMVNPIFRFLLSNAIPIATYQLALEAGFIIIFGLLLYTGRCTADGVVARLEALRYPFMSWIKLDDCTYEDGIDVAGVMTLNPEKLTAVHTGHNIASGLFPLQLTILICTYPFVMRGFRAAVAMASGGKAVAGAGAAAVSAAVSATADAKAHRAASKVAKRAAPREQPQPQQMQTPPRRPAYTLPPKKP